ncbi:MAG: signal peptidase I [Candidatus Hydrogenedentes bacterium]|nr:signal peptidase I [Candidatus Hydrogenedentota bacterium]
MTGGRSSYSPPPDAPEREPECAPNQVIKRELVEFAKMVFVFLILFLVLRSYVMEAYEVQGESMEPTLMNGERILVFKLPHWLSTHRVFASIDPFDAGDIIVFDSPDDRSKRYVKRVVAEGARPVARNTVAAEGEDGDTARDSVPVRIEDGSLFVNNRRVEEDYLPDGADREIDCYDSIPWDSASLERGEYYVLGDNRGVSKDSRRFGPVKDDTIIGKAVLRFWPLQRISLLR